MEPLRASVIDDPLRHEQVGFVEPVRVPVIIIGRLVSGQPVQFGTLPPEPVPEPVPLPEPPEPDPLGQQVVGLVEHVAFPGGVAVGTRTFTGRVCTVNPAILRRVPDPVPEALISPPHCSFDFVGASHDPRESELIESGFRDKTNRVIGRD